MNTYGYLPPVTKLNQLSAAWTTFAFPWLEYRETLEMCKKVPVLNRRCYFTPFTVATNKIIMYIMLLADTSEAE